MLAHEVWKRNFCDNVGDLLSFGQLHSCASQPLRISIDLVMNCIFTAWRTADDVECKLASVDRLAKEGNWRNGCDSKCRHMRGEGGTEGLVGRSG